MKTYENKVCAYFSWAVTIIVSIAAVLLGIYVFRQTFAAFINGKFRLMDYGVYTNFIWNTAHGRPFLFLVTENYLETHLSFSVVLLAPLFRIWDDPLLMLSVKWALLVAGIIVFMIIAVKQRIPREIMAALLFFLLGHYFTQSNMFDDFHGVDLYYLLVPCLYGCLLYRRSLTWLPLILILGVREDAFLFILPMLLYFAVKLHWKDGYVLAGLSFIYGVLAILVLYPLINDQSILARRAMELDPEKMFTVFGEDRAYRVTGFILAWTPVLVFAGRSILPLIVFPSLYFICAMFSGDDSFQELLAHFSPPIAMCLAAGIIEVTARPNNVLLQKDSSRSSWVNILRSLLLVGVCIGSSAWQGFFISGKQLYRRFWEPASAEGRLLLDAARNVPKDGLLVVNRHRAEFFANRAMMTTWERYAIMVDTGFHPYDVLCIHLAELNNRRDGEILDAVRAGELGVCYLNGSYVVLQRGYDTSANETLIRLLEMGPTPVACTAKHGGDDTAYSTEESLLRYWEGKGHKTPITLSYGWNRFLEPGKYNAVFSYRAAVPRKAHADTWGRFSVHVLNDQGPSLAEQEIYRVVSAPVNYIEQTIPFEVKTATNIEARITGGDAELWLNSIQFEQRVPSQKKSPDKQDP